ncbi:MAG: hypothetical protein AAF674_03885 [Pseudomonadota bacterium]
MEGWQIQVLIGAVFVLAAMLFYVYKPRPKAPQPRIPPELRFGNAAVADPFRDPKVLDQRLEDFGRFNVRYNEVDGIMLWPWSVFFRRWLD